MKKIKRKVKRKVKKVQKKVKKKARFHTLGYLYSWVYFLGLTALIPFILFNAAPTELGIWSGTPSTILTIALLLIIGAFAGMIKIHKKKSDAFQALALTTLIPGVLALIISFVGRPLIYSLVKWLAQDLGQIEKLIILYMNRALPQVWFLTFAYISIGGIMYLVSKSMKSHKH